MALLITLSILYLINNSLLATCVLLPVWILLFRPWNRADFFVFAIAALFFLGQDYAVLKKGGFSFAQHDFLLMPYYEPFLWGFYYLHIKRVIGDQMAPTKVSFHAVIGLFATGVAFSLFSNNSTLLLIATLISTSLLLFMFHEKNDLCYGIYTLALGFVIEYFGVYNGLWSYPMPDFLGIPYWFATMWFSVGILGRRFLLPLAEQLALITSNRTTSS